MGGTKVVVAVVVEGRGKGGWCLGCGGGVGGCFLVCFVGGSVAMALLPPGRHAETLVIDRIRWRPEGSGFMVVEREGRERVNG